MVSTEVMYDSEHIVAGRRSFPALQIFHKRVRHFSPVVVGDAGGRTLDVLHQSIQIVARIGDADHANRSAIPKAARFEFGNRYIKAGPQTVLQAAHNLTFVLKRLRRFDVKFEREEGDGHSVLSSQFSVLSKHAGARTEN